MPPDTHATTVDVGEPMNANDVTTLVEARRDRRARERFVEAHLPTVRAIAARYRGLNVPLEDLVQEGCIGLLDAIEIFDPSRGVDFETFSRFQIRCAIRDALTETSRLIRLPKRVVEGRRAIDHVELELATVAGHVPSALEIADVLGLPLRAVAELRAAPSGWLSLESPFGQGLADTTAVDPAGDAARQEELSRLQAAVEALPARQRELVSRRFGLGCPAEELAEVAVSLHVSRQRARAIEHAALYALRDRLEAPGSSEGGKPCKRTFSSPTVPSTGRRGRSQRRSPMRSARTASLRMPSRR
jgi:RNA polymerase sigma factor (sigma-70 family)